MMPEALPATTVRPWLPLLACLGLLGACASPGGSTGRAGEAAAEASGAATDEKPMVTSAGEDSARMMVAETALERGDCRAAAEEYARLAAGSKEPRVATRATQVGIACAQLDPARRSAERWRALDPYDTNAALAAGIVALQLYRLDDARSALAAWRETGSAGNQDPGAFAELLARESDATAAYRVFTDVLVGDDPTAEVLLAQARLAQQAYDLKAAIRIAEKALELEARLVEAKVLIARSRAIQGDVDGALTLAREIQPELGGEDAFIVADILDAAERDDAARAELERLSADPELALSARRRLAAQAFSAGDLDAAEAQFTALMGERGATAVALLYLAQIAERKGDDARALQNYELLADSSLGLSARASAARLLLKKGQRTQALQLLDDYGKKHPDEVIEVSASRAQTLAAQGLFDAAIADIDASLERYPGHPTLEYQRATILERAGRKKDSVKAFKALVKKRPEDPGVTNALGFTLADHRSELALAERLVRQALAVSPDSPAIQDSEGWVLFRRGRTREAAEVLERAFRNLRDPEIGAHFGEVLWKLGDQGRAHYVWQQALDVDPANAVLRGTIQRVTGEEPSRPAH